MTNLIEQAINCNDGDLAAKIIRDALGIDSDDVTNYCFPKEWPANHEQRAAHHWRLATDQSSVLGRTKWLFFALFWGWADCRPKDWASAPYNEATLHEISLCPILAASHHHGRLKNRQSA